MKLDRHVYAGGKLRPNDLAMLEKLAKRHFPPAVRILRDRGLLVRNDSQPPRGKRHDPR